MKREYKVIMLLILVISIVALVLTSSYALFSFEEKGKVENKLVTGVYSSCSYEDGTLGGIFAYSRWHQDGEVWTSYRIVLTP